MFEYETFNVTSLTALANSATNDVNYAIEHVLRMQNIVREHDRIVHEHHWWQVLNVAINIAHTKYVRIKSILHKLSAMSIFAAKSLSDRLQSEINDLRLEIDRMEAILLEALKLSMTLRPPFERLVDMVEFT